MKELLILAALVLLVIGQWKLVRFMWSLTRQAQRDSGLPPRR